MAHLYSVGSMNTVSTKCPKLTPRVAVSMTLAEARAILCLDASAISNLTERARALRGLDKLKRACK